MIYQPTFSPWQERRLRAIEQAEADAAATVAANAYWQAKASEVAAQKKAERDREKRARAEIVSYILEPGSMSELVMARATMDAPPAGSVSKAPKKFVWMPKGTHAISASTMSGATYEGTVICDERGANAVIASFGELTRAGWRSYIDFAHRDSEAAAWVGGFSWDPARGIVVAVDWTNAGETAVLDRVFMSFSPTFWIDRESGRVNGLVEGHAAGALVNAPAFGTAMPPILAGHAMAELIRESLVTAGRPESTAAVVAAAIEAGRSPKAIRVLIETLP